MHFMDIVPIRQAILSVFKKDGIEKLGNALIQQNCHLLSTGGTGNALTAAGIAYQEVSDYTGSPEMLQGRVKTLHPKIHGGLLYKRKDKNQAAEAAQYGIKAIDLVAVNLYPFEETIAQPDVTVDVATENIDIGGPTMIRAAAKNFKSVTVITDPADYDLVIRELQEKGGISCETRKKLAIKAFAHTSAYDKAITGYLSNL
jgi:phosphoribosylaminoimidazolecarboxamide formyltransferase / IMP cyclohydrolase